jgi:hypothetical protein
VRLVGSERVCVLSFALFWCTARLRRAAGAVVVCEATSVLCYVAVASAG